MPPRDLVRGNTQSCRQPLPLLRAGRVLTTRDRLNEELLRIWEKTKTTILFVTHSIYEAAFLSQQVLMLASKPGRVRELVPVGFPLPRRLALRDTAEFVTLAARLRDILETC